MSSFDFGQAYADNKDALVGDLVPEDTYVVVVKTAKSGMTQGGKAKFGLQLEIVEGPLAGRTIPDQLTWSPESEVAMRIFSEGLDILGASKDWIIAAQPTQDQIAERITGSRVEIFAKESEFNGRPRINVNYRRRISAGAQSSTPTQLTADSDVDQQSGGVPTGDPWAAAGAAASL